MEKNNRIVQIHFFMNFVFYIGVLLTFYLFLIEDNSVLWLFAIIFVVAGALYTTIPDMLINIGVKCIKKNTVRCANILKGVIFILLYTTMNENNWLYITIMIAIIFLVDIPVEIILGKQLKNMMMTKEEIKSRMLNQQNKNSEKLMKTLLYEMLSIVFFMNMQESIIEIVIFSIICLWLHSIFSEKILLIIKENRGIKSEKIRMILWIIHCSIMVFAILKVSSLCYLLIGFYWMFVWDIAIKPETAIIKINEK